MWTFDICGEMNPLDIFCIGGSEFVFSPWWWDQPWWLTSNLHLSYSWEAYMTRPFFQPKSSPISRPMTLRRSPKLRLVLFKKLRCWLLLIKKSFLAIVTGNSHTIGSNNENDTPDKRLHSAEKTQRLTTQQNVHNLTRTAENTYRYVHGNLITLTCRCHMQRIRYKMKRDLTKYKFTLHQMVPNAKRRSSL